MRRLNLNAIIFLLVIGAITILKMHSGRSEKNHPREGGSQESASHMPSQSPPAAVSSATQPSPQLRVGQVPIQQIPDVVPGLFKDHGPFAHELEVYSILKRKVFLSASEKSEKSELLKNPSLLRAMGERLKRADLEPEAAHEQNLALDLVLEALRSGDSQAASAVLADVVADKQIENNLLGRPSRESLAGIKAQILYVWTALKPDQALSIPRLLPGPVSRKIWDNVQAAQESNRNESETQLGD